MRSVSPDLCLLLKFNRKAIGLCMDSVSLSVDYLAVLVLVRSEVLRVLVHGAEAHTH